MKTFLTRLFAGALGCVFVFAPARTIHAADADDAQATMTSAMGTFVAQSLLMTYVSIGTTADAYTKKAYTPEEATNVLDTCQSTMKVAQTALRKLIDTGAISSTSDVKFVKDSIAAYDDLTEEAADVKACIKSMSPANVKRFTAKKDEAWKKITAIVE